MSDNDRDAERERDRAEDRDRALELARKVATVVNHPATPAAERESAKARLEELTAKWGFSDGEIYPEEPLDDAPDVEEPRVTLDQILETMGVTRKQAADFVGSLAVKGVAKLVDSMTRPKPR